MAEDIATRAEFLSFLADLRSDLIERPAEWENPDLAGFLEAMEAWIRDLDGHYANVGRPVPAQPSWQMLADILNAARVYE
jgi:hypothetical protein